MSPTFWGLRSDSTELMFPNYVKNFILKCTNTYLYAEKTIHLPCVLWIVGGNEKNVPYRGGRGEGVYMLKDVHPIRWRRHLLPQFAHNLRCVSVGGGWACRWLLNSDNDTNLCSLSVHWWTPSVGRLWRLARRVASAASQAETSTFAPVDTNSFHLVLSTAARSREMGSISNCFIVLFRLHV